MANINGRYNRKRPILLLVFQLLWIYGLLSILKAKASKIMLVFHLAQSKNKDYNETN